MSYDRPNRRIWRPGAIATVLLLGIFCVGALIVGNTVFVIKTIDVEGILYCTREEVIEAAGIQIGDSMFSIDKNKVREGINKNRYLGFQSLWPDYPSHVIIRVEEYTPRAVLTSMGILAKINKQGVVLEETAQIDEEFPVPLITGASANIVRVGYPVTYSVPGQGEAIQNLLDALEYQGVVAEISELNVATLDNLYLITCDGLQVLLGDANNMGEKIALMQMTLSQLRGSMDIRGGVLNVTTTREADYRAPITGN